MKDALSRLILPGGQAAPQHGNHGIPAPVLEKGKAGQNGLLRRGGAVGNKLVGRHGKHLGRLIPKTGLLPHRVPVLPHILKNLLRVRKLGLHPIYNMERLLPARRHSAGNAVVHRRTPGFPSPVADIICIMMAVAKRKRHFPQYPVGFHMQPLPVGSDKPILYGKFLLFGKLMPLRNKLHVGIHLQRNLFPGKVPYLIRDSNRVLPLYQRHAPHHFHALHKISPLRIVLIGECRLVKIAFFPE